VALVEGLEAADEERDASFKFFILNELFDMGTFGGEVVDAVLAKAVVEVIPQLGIEYVAFQVHGLFFGENPVPVPPDRVHHP
jgi:hypothetical protein